VVVVMALFCLIFQIKILLSISLVVYLALVVLLSTKCKQIFFFSNFFLEDSENEQSIIIAFRFPRLFILFFLRG